MDKYEIFKTTVDRVRDAISRGDEVQVPLVSLETKCRVYVRARVAETPDFSTNAEPIVVVDDLGEKVGRLFVEIKGELSDEEVAALPTK